MNANFDRALRLVLQWEGGFVDDKLDPGGATNLGVTLGTAKAWGLDEDHNGLIDVRDVKLLTPELVGPIYRQGYWNKVGCDDLASGLDLLAFDCAVNQGPGAAGLMLAQSAHDLDTFRALREARYRANHHFDHFGHGWLNRLASVTAQARQWALEPAQAA